MREPIVRFAALHKQLIHDGRAANPNKHSSDAEIDRLLEREGVGDHHITKSYFRAPLPLFPHFLLPSFDTNYWLQYLRDPKFHWPFQCQLCTKCFQCIDYRITKHWKKEHIRQYSAIPAGVSEHLRHRAFYGQEPPEAIWSRFVKQVTERAVSTNPFVVNTSINIPAALAAAPKVPQVPAAVAMQKPPASVQQPAGQRISESEQIQNDAEVQFAPEQPKAPSPQPPAMLTPESTSPTLAEPTDAAQTVSRPHLYLTNATLTRMTQAATTENKQHEVNRRPQRSNTKRKQDPAYILY
jgi:hypothetical protein